MRRFILGFLCHLLLNIHGSSSRGTGLLAQLLKITATQNRPVILILDNRPHIKNGNADRGDATNDNIYSLLYYKQNRDKDGTSTPLDDDPSLRTVRYVDTRNDRYDDFARYTPNTDYYETYNDRYTGRNTYDYKITNDNDRYNRYDNTKYTETRYEDTRYTDTNTTYNPYTGNRSFDSNIYTIPDILMLDMMMADMMVADMMIADMMIADMLIADMMIPDILTPDILIPTPDITHTSTTITIPTDITPTTTKLKRIPKIIDMTILDTYTDAKHDDTRYDNTRYNPYTGNYNDYNKYTNRYYDSYGYNTD